MEPIRKQIIKRILSGCVKNGYCIEVNKKPTQTGYPQIYIRKMGASGHAHRLMWFVYHGFIPHKKVIMYLCDNRKCINPRHLKLGDDKENLRDMRNKGRGYILPKGEKCPMAKFKDREIEEMREMAALGIKYSEIAKIYNVDNS